MLMFKDARIPLDLGSTFCGSSGEEAEDSEDGEDEEDGEYGEGGDHGEQHSGEDNDDPMSTSTASSSLSSSTSSLRPVESLLSRGSSPSERFVLGLPLEPESRVVVQTARRAPVWDTAMRIENPRVVSRGLGGESQRN